ncbi:outer membrane protein [Sphingomonas sp. MMS24-J13]|uniref:outer membrane protein n=1 Tax=Sphingomonas sp. MMS24-J13 TaxID=3238686 RepID=UPI00384FCA89
MKTLFVAAGVAALALSAPLAAETFDGPYVGAQAGYNHDSYGNVESRLGQIGVDNSRDSFNGGAFVGYDHRINSKFVLGGEAGFDIGTNDNRTDRRPGGFTSIDPRHAFDVSARAGYLVNDRTLLYVRGGYENVDARVTLANASGINRDVRTYDGWLAGVGAERYLTDKVSARIEYRYSDLGGSDTRFHRQQGLVGVAYHF